jgi:hypothetical protein
MKEEIGIKWMLTFWHEGKESSCLPPMFAVLYLKEFFLGSSHD